MPRELREFQSIPPIVDELGSGWDQPDHRNFLIDDEWVVMRTKDFEELHEYSASRPSGVYDGKMWRRHDGAHDPRCRPEDRVWLLCWFGPSEDPGKCSTNFRKIRLYDGELPK